MTTYVYRRASSSGARELADALGGRRIRGRIRPVGEVVRAGDVVVCWGEYLPPINGVRILNGAPVNSKYSDAVKLAQAGIPTVTVTNQRPAAGAAVQNDGVVKPLWEEAVEAAEDFVELPYRRENPAFIAGIKEFAATIAKLQAEMAKPVADPTVWLGRVNNHIGGTDLLNPPAAPEYWVKKELLDQEVRIHSFNGKSIRAGMKRPRVGNNVQPHQWIRSYDGGWSINYDGFESIKAQRELAHRAVAALGLQFGAVDLGRVAATQRWMVLEVNRAPGLENNTVGTYADAIKGWIAG